MSGIENPTSPGRNRHRGLWFAGMERTRTLAQVARRPEGRSFWRDRLAMRAAPLSVHEYLIDEANLRGVWGAFRANTSERPPDLWLSFEDVVVGLLHPQAPAEARVLKLVVRLLQTGRLDLTRLLVRARREGAVFGLHWLLQQIPGEERNAPVQELIALLGPGPRGYRALDYRYDAQRLVRHVARREDLWRKHPRSS